MVKVGNKYDGYEMPEDIFDYVWSLLNSPLAKGNIGYVLNQLPETIRKQIRIRKNQKFVNSNSIKYFFTDELNTN